ncbi:Alpha/Beta hydrolase protein [Cantharellus anzutake]|uniref:Alpha/Beta hydrolase protein n=1 Tax=Cantharellus anzutake TaxID=1750568 RepID=UPI00190308F2|nr:Alpha/Beta hydrolase protein [Cantharellus anzutake]KAF8334773.1 Alpha/Beta hydrolase protein [Cantharellus anzutake]
MKSILLVVLSLCCSVLSLPPFSHPSGWSFLASPRWTDGVPSPTNLTGPQVQLAQGLLTGLSVPQFGQDYFLGIPYAQPPLGELRFAKPQPLTVNASETIDATKFGNACLQPIRPGTLDITVSDLSEDCLFINVFRPSNLPRSANLPVMVWIYGGSFTTGASQTFNGTEIVRQSVFLNESVIFVSFNYRLNAFGFLGSPELADPTTGTLNAGLYDMIGALKWVQENIGAFGGNKDRVTVFGESAGAMGIGSLLVAGGGQYAKEHNLFHGAIMESGFPAGIPAPIVSDLLPWTSIFVAAAGCPPSNSSIISCLRSKSSEALYRASLVTLNATHSAFPFNRVVDGFFFKEGGAAEEVRRGNVATVPVITGCNLDEGTQFIPHTFNTSDEMKLTSVCLVAAELLYVGNLSLATPEQTKLFNVLLDLYPDIPALGSPYNPIRVSKNDRFFGPHNQYKRAASVFGDSVFHSGRRALLDAYVKRNANYPAWSYHYTQVAPGAPPYLGVYHGSEVPSVFGLYAVQNRTTVLGTTSLYMVSAWVAFANSFQPNRPYLPKWPQYGKQRHMLHIGNGDFNVITDDFRKKGIEFLRSKDFTDTFNL